MMASPAPTHGRRLGIWLLLALFLILFLVCFDPDALAWDGAFYYATARSLLFDGDIHLANDLVLAQEVTPPDFVSAHFERRLTATGHVASPFALGTSLLWLPWFALVAGIARLAGAHANSLTGYEWYFRWTIASVTSVYGWLAFVACYRLLRRMLDIGAVLGAVMTAMLSTPLIYYQFREPFYSHPVSALAVAIAVATWWPMAAPNAHSSPRSALQVGAWIGLAALIRTQNILYLVLPASTACAALISAVRQRDRRGAARSIALGTLSLASALLVLSPQFAAWQVIYGRPFLVPQGPRFMDWRAPWLGEVLFSPFHGLLPWLPLTLPAGVGLLLAIHRQPRRIAPLCAAFLVQAYANGCVVDWAGGGGYGARRFSDMLVILALGYACLLAWRKAAAYRALGATLCLLLVIHQWLILRYGFSDGLGGSVLVTDQGSFTQAATGREFLLQLFSYVPLALRHPLQTLILPRSPLARAFTDFSPFAVQLAGLAGVMTLTHGAVAAWRRIVPRVCTHRRTWPLCAALLACGVLLLNGWLLAFG